MPDVLQEVFVVRYKGLDLMLGPQSDGTVQVRFVIVPTDAVFIFMPSLFENRTIIR